MFLIQYALHRTRGDPTCYRQVIQQLYLIKNVVHVHLENFCVIQEDMGIVRMMVLEELLNGHLM